MARTGSAGTTAWSRNTTTERPRRMPTSEADRVSANRAMTALSLLQGRQVERPRVVGDVLDPGQVLAQHHDVAGVGDEDDGGVLGDDLACLTIQTVGRGLVGGLQGLIERLVGLWDL